MTDYESSSMFDMNSKFWRTTLLIVAVLLIFAGPTYVPYVMTDILDVSYVASVFVGLVLLIVGLLLLWFLVRKKAIV
jgi:uncharacterized membrane protein HdeD (DUF308 family)